MVPSSEPTPSEARSWGRARRIAAWVLGLGSLYVCLAIVSHFFTGWRDHSLVDELRINGWFVARPDAANWVGSLGAWMSHYLVFEWWGLSSLVIPVGMGLAARKLYMRTSYDPRPLLLPLLGICIYVNTVLGFLAVQGIGEPLIYTFSGGLGYEVADLLKVSLGWLAPFFLLFLLLGGLFYYLRMPFLGLWKEVGASKSLLDSIPSKGEEDTALAEEEESSSSDTVSEESPPKEEEDRALAEEEESSSSDTVSEESPSKEDDDTALAEEEESSSSDTVSEESPLSSQLTTREEPLSVPSFELEFLENYTDEEPSLENQEKTAAANEDMSSSSELAPVSFEVEELGSGGSDEEALERSSVPAVVEDSPSLSYQLPPVSLLASRKSEKVQIDPKELEQNKDKIVETLTNFRIDISNIKATIGPTVTLYEIVPAPGVRISKIKNLENDIALSLSALGIRIIAPMPGKGTIGIEVPNKKREITSMSAALLHPNFESCDYDLPIVLGKNISGEVEVVDLCRMPHILMAGATGQGKSVGINVILSSLLYKKRPDELKLVLIDPKKVELSLFSCIERHFLAKVSQSEEPIITDMQQVIHTLSSLCREMDDRYERLKEARCRNIKEYNAIQSKGSGPLSGRLPYIVLVIDELADLMMTAGKEVEMPIARLAQLARAIGIHLIVATQRPSVNVITGIIKANFPARISYRVSSQIDSRTILDARGAEQLVGMGDMLFSTGNEQHRLQCPYIDTKEVEAICQFISSQASNGQPYLLPEVATETSTKQRPDIKERDALFAEAATLVVRHQQGSASLLQRKMEIGFNRAGRLIDQMEAVQIVGPPQGSKPREVLVIDEMSLSQLLNALEPTSHHET